MKKIKIKNIVFGLMLSIVGIGSTAQVSRIEGLSYIDGKPIALEIENGKISKVEEVAELSEASKNLYISPGLIDNQVNGYLGVSFSFGGSELTESKVEKATIELWKNGVTSYLPTLTSNSHELLIKNLKILAISTENPGLLGSIPGFHLEGPYLNPADGYRGAHPKQYIRLPDWDEFIELNEASNGKVLQITLAPEMEGAQEFIRKCTKLGITVALGHHNANFEQVNMAVSNGAKISTHFGNGCANMVNRHSNPFWPQLANNDLMLSIICDGFHLLPEEIITFIKAKGIDKIVMTSDVTSYAGLPPGDYVTNSGDTIELTKSGKLQLPRQEILYGSASPLSKGIGHVMKTTGCSLADAIQMASTNAAELYGLNDRGVLEVGKRADVILFKMDDSGMHVAKTFVQGELVFSSKN